MIIIYHGPPGSYKSFSLMQDVLIPALRQGKTVVTNLRGFSDIDKIEELLKEQFPITSKIINIPFDRDGSLKMATFFHWAPKGALIAIDEVTKCYPTSLTNLSVFDYPEGPEAAERDSRPPTCGVAFDMHRHYNWDIYFTVPNIAKVHKEVRGAAEYAFRFKNKTGLFPWSKHTYKQVQHDPENSGKSISHEIGSPKNGKANTNLFNLYQSTDTGSTTTVNSNPSILKQPKIVIMLLMALSSPFLIYTVIPSKDNEPTQKSDKQIDQPNSLLSNVSDTNNSDQMVDSTSNNPIADLIFNPSLEIYYQGQIDGNYILTFHDQTITTKQLAQYSIGTAANRFHVTLFFNTLSRTIYPDFREHRSSEYEYVDPSIAQTTTNYSNDQVQSIEPQDFSPDLNPLN